MSTCTSQDTYISQGTISVHCSFSNNGPKTHLIFVPCNDYSVKQGNKTFAAFVPQSCGCTLDSCGCKPGFCNRAIIREYDRDKGRGVKILVNGSGCMEAISGAALREIKVELEVKENISAATMDAKKQLAEAAERAKKIVKKDGKDAKEIAKAAKKAAKAKAAMELMQAINEDRPCLTLTGITVPAK